MGRYIRTDLVDGFCRSCGYKGRFKGKGQYPKCRSSAVDARVKRIKLPTNWMSVLDQERNRVHNLLEALTEAKKRNTFQHELTELLKLEVGEERFREILAKAQDNTGIILLKKKNRKKKVKK